MSVAGFVRCSKCQTPWECAAKAKAGAVVDCKRAVATYAATKTPRKPHKNSTCPWDEWKPSRDL